MCSNGLKLAFLTAMIVGSALVGGGAHARADTVQLAAAPQSGSDQPTRSSKRSEMVRRIQQGLADQGFYLGPVDGLLGPGTRAAIRAYQKSARLPEDGEPSPMLLQDLEGGGKISALLSRLEDSRRTHVEQARDALLSSPQTRHLVNVPLDSEAPGHHDAEACFAAPEPRCLLTEAALAAENIERDELRFWALGEILAAQAKAGLAQDAMNSARRIRDPRLIMVALSGIAKAQAEAGRDADAMAAVDIVPDVEMQVEAYISIAEIQAKRGEAVLAKDTALHMIGYLDRIKDPLKRISLKCRIAVILWRSGHVGLSRTHLNAVETQVQAMTRGHTRDEALRHLASALAETGAPERALSILKAVQNGSGDTPVLMAAATGQARAGAPDEALITADSIEAVRYRALVLARIAAYQAGAGETDKAGATLARALEAAGTIRFPFAKAYAYSRIALALNDVGISSGNDTGLLTQALETAALIGDDRLKAHILWTITDERRRADDRAGATLAEAAALDASASIKSPFSRVWMLCDVAESRAKADDQDGAWSVFGTALEEARSIVNPWGRARALGKVGTTLVTLADRQARQAEN